MAEGRTILIVDDDEEICRSTAGLLAEFGWTKTARAPDGSSALEWLGAHEALLVLLDLNLPGMDGETVLARIAENHPELPVIIVSGNADLAKVKACLKKGAYDYFVKPADPEELEAAVRRAAGKREADDELRQLAATMLRPEEGALEAFSGIVTNSQKLNSLFAYATAVSRSPEPVLIMGESGTGKELFARGIHKASGLGGPFVAVNLAGLDDALLSILFGHRKGAFTGAMEARAGLAERAAEGILFLDEIGDLEAASQVKLLRFLQEGEYFKLGSDTASKLRIKVVAATHRDLEESVRSGKFRLDLYYRLSAHRLMLPALRERSEDIPLLAAHFLEEAAAKLGRPPAALSEGALDVLSAYSFPGNIRELRSLMVDALYGQEGGEIGDEYLSTRLGRSPDPPEPESAPAGTHGAKASPGQIHFPGALPSLKDATELLIEEALRRSGGNQSRAAALIGISHQAMSKRLKKKPADGGGIDPEEDD